jgi:hypothetical protein
MNEPRVIDGVRLPDDGSLTENEKAWIEFIRLVSKNTDPEPTFRAVQALKQAMPRLDAE